jgi:Zn-finger domain-containing protein
MATNRSQQAELAEDIRKKQEELQALQEHAKMLKRERKQGRITKKRLRHSLSAKERALLEFGMEMAMKNRVREISSEEAASEGVSSGGDEEVEE